MVRATSRWPETILPPMRPFKFLLAAVFAATAHIAACPTAAGQTLPGTRLLRSGKLEVEVMDPDSPERYHRGTRFSCVANVLKARMNGVDFLYAPDGPPHDPLLLNGGLASEFDISSSDPPPGFSEARVGEGFLKIGVGVLRKTGGTYEFWKLSPMLFPATTRSVWFEDRALFVQSCMGPNGYGYRLETEVRMEADLVVIFSRLTNTGDRKITTSQYAHNFFFFDEKKIGPSYEVEFPYEMPRLDIPARAAEVLSLCGNKIVFTENLARSANLEIPYPGAYRGENKVVVRDVESGQQIVATTSIPGQFTHLHTNTQYVCPEQFIRLELEPGKSGEWTRTYQFVTGKK